MDVRILLAIGVLLLGGVGWHWTPWVGPHARIVHLEKDKSDLQTDLAKEALNAAAWKASYKQSEDLRKAEQERATTAVNDDAKACDARVAEARRSSAAIRTITRREPTTDAQGCPTRQLVPADQLRDALQPATR